MATFLQAIQRFRPRIRRGKPAGHAEISTYIGESTGLDRHEIRMALGKLSDALLHYARQGRGIKLEGILSIWPTIDTKGKLSFGKRFNIDLMDEFNNMKLFQGQIENVDRLQWSKQDYIDSWNAEHPEDPIE